MSKKTLVIGASENTSRYSAQAISMLQEYNHDVIAIGRRNGEVHTIQIGSELEKFEDVDTVTMYINPNLQTQYIDYILSLKPNRVIFNPGTENPEFSKILRENGIEVSIACTLVMLRTGQY
jgi:predicted CoA-binding protein